MPRPPNSLALARRGTVRSPDATPPRWMPPTMARLAALAGGLRRGAQRSDAAAPVDPTPAHRRPFARIIDRPQIEVDLYRLIGRLRVQDAVVVSPRVVSRAAALTLVAIAVGRVVGADALGVLIAFVAGLWAATVIVRALLRRIGPFEAARRADDHLRLRAQLATALELLDGNVEGELAALQIATASTAARTIVPSSALPAVPTDPRWRRDAATRFGASVVALAASAAILAWPDPPVDPRIIDEPTLVLADARAPGEAPLPPVMPDTSDRAGNGDAIESRGARPSEAGSQANGLLGDRKDGDGTGSPQGGQAPSDASRTGQAQDGLQPPSAAARAEALQKLGDALRQAQASRSAGESLRRGDAARAADQLNQLADQLPKLGPGERETLANAFDQASKDTQSSDRQVSDAARQASQALSQFRENDARDAVRREANAVRQAGEAATAQRDRDTRASDLARGSQPSLPQGDQSGVPQPKDGAKTPPQSGAGEGQSGGGGPARVGDDAEGGLGTLDQQLRTGSADASGNATGPGSGVGSGAGSAAPGRATRLEAQAVPVAVEAQQGEGPSTWRPPRSDTPAAPPPAPASLPGGPASSAPIGAASDVNAIPREHAGAVRRYFTPDVETGAPAPKPPPTRGLVDGRP